jgi:regulator of protease activity HflC (stomatin/prohibitin superfamily)
MSWFLALVFAAIGVWLGLLKDKRQPAIWPAWGGFIGLMFGAVVGMSFFSVPAAHVGVVYNPLRGGIQMNTVIPEGIHLISPFTTRETFSTQTQEYTLSSQKDEGAVIGDDSIHCQTNEGLGADLDLTVLWHVDPSRAATGYDTVLLLASC